MPAQYTSVTQSPLWVALVKFKQQLSAMQIEVQNSVPQDKIEHAYVLKKINEVNKLIGYIESILDLFDNGKMPSIGDIFSFIFNNTSIIYNTGVIKDFTAFLTPVNPANDFQELIKNNLKNAISNARPTKGVFKNNVLFTEENKKTFIENLKNNLRKISGINTLPVYSSDQLNEFLKTVDKIIDEIDFIILHKNNEPIESAKIADLIMDKVIQEFEEKAENDSRYNELPLFNVTRKETYDLIENILFLLEELPENLKDLAAFFNPTSLTLDTRNIPVADSIVEKVIPTFKVVTTNTENFSYAIYADKGKFYNMSLLPSGNKSLEKNTLYMSLENGELICTQVDSKAKDKNNQIITCKITAAKDWNLTAPLTLEQLSPYEHVIMKKAKYGKKVNEINGSKIYHDIKPELRSELVSLLNDYITVFADKNPHAQDKLIKAKLLGNFYSSYYHDEFTDVYRVIKTEYSTAKEAKVLLTNPEFCSRNVAALTNFISSIQTKTQTPINQLIPDLPENIKNDTAFSNAPLSDVFVIADDEGKLEVVSLAKKIQKLTEIKNFYTEHLNKLNQESNPIEEQIMPAQDNGSIPDIVKNPVEVVEVAPVQTVEVAPVQTVEVAPVQTVEEVPVQTVEEVPVQTVEVAPVQTVEAPVVEQVFANKVFTKEDLNSLKENRNTVIENKQNAEKNIQDLRKEVNDNSLAKKLNIQIKENDFYTDVPTFEETVNQYTLKEEFKTNSKKLVEKRGELIKYLNNKQAIDKGITPLIIFNNFVNQHLNKFDFKAIDAKLRDFYQIDHSLTATTNTFKGLKKFLKDFKYPNGFDKWKSDYTNDQNFCNDFNQQIAKIVTEHNELVELITFSAEFKDAESLTSSLNTINILIDSIARYNEVLDTADFIQHQDKLGLTALVELSKKPYFDNKDAINQQIKLIRDNLGLVSAQFLEIDKLDNNELNKIRVAGYKMLDVILGTIAENEMETLYTQINNIKTRRQEYLAELELLKTSKDISFADKMARYNVLVAKNNELLIDLDNLNQKNDSLADLIKYHPNKDLVKKVSDGLDEISGLKQSQGQFRDKLNKKLAFFNKVGISNLVSVFNNNVDDIITNNSSISPNLNFVDANIVKLQPVLKTLTYNNESQEFNDEIESQPLDLYEDSYPLQEIIDGFDLDNNSTSEEINEIISMQQEVKKHISDEYSNYAASLGNQIQQAIQPKIDFLNQIEGQTDKETVQNLLSLIEQLGEINRQIEEFASNNLLFANLGVSVNDQLHQDLIDNKNTLNNLILTKTTLLLENINQEISIKQGDVNTLPAVDMIRVKRYFSNLLTDTNQDTDDVALSLANISTYLRNFPLKELNMLKSAISTIEAYSVENSPRVEAITSASSRSNKLATSFALILGVKNLKDDLDEYVNWRKPSATRIAFINEINNKLDSYIQTGDSNELLYYIQTERANHPGLNFQPLLNRTILEIEGLNKNNVLLKQKFNFNNDDQAISDLLVENPINQMEIDEILTQLKNSESKQKQKLAATFNLYYKQANSLIERGESINNGKYSEEDKKIGEKSVALGNELKTEMNQFIKANQANLLSDEPSTLAQDFKKFNNHLKLVHHKYDDTLSKRTGYGIGPLIFNLSMTIFTILQLIDSKISTGVASGFWKAKGLCQVRAMTATSNKMEKEIEKAYSAPAA